MPAVRRGVFEVYRDAAGLWRWRLLSPNGRIVADSGEGYRAKGSASIAADALALVARWAVRS